MINILDVKKEKKKIYAISKDSPFYPDGKGGQLGDRGKIGNANVLFVEYKDEEYYHLIDKEIEPGEYEYEIDFNRRRDIAQQHTAQHIISAVFEQIADMDTLGFRVGEEYTTIDLDYKSEKYVEEAERISNEIIQKGIDVEEVFTTVDKMHEYNLRNPLSEKVKGTVRLIKIGDFDINPCGGFHVKNTGEIGLIKVIDREKIKGNLIRFYFLAGNRALKDYDERIKITKTISNLMTSKIEETPKRVEETINKMKEYKSKYEKLNEKYAELISKDIINNAEIINGIKFIYLDTNDDYVSNLPKFLPMDEVFFVVKIDNRFEISSKKVNCKELINNIRKDHPELKGGGGEHRGSIIGNISVEEIKKFLRKL